MSLLDALGVRRGDVVALAGAGGKTTLAFALAAEARAAGLRVLVTTTTHMGTLPEAVTGPVFVEAEGGLHPALEQALERHGLATLLGRRLREDKLQGIAPERVDALAARADLVLVEADGARGRSLKLPAEHEPVVPASTTLFVAVAALDVLGEPLDESRVHRLERVTLALSRPAGATVDEEVLVAVLRHPAGYASRVPAASRSLVFLNKADDAARLAAASRIAGPLRAAWDRVAAGSARASEARRVGRIAGIVLAAGASTRMGRPKMTLPLGAGTVLSAAVEPLLAAPLDDVVVVLGHEAESVRRSAGLPADPRLRLVVNASWRDGLSSSLHAGLEACGEADAVLVALGDQPGLAPDAVRRILAAWSPRHPLVVPAHEGRAAHPVLFARALFDELRGMAGDRGARDVVIRHWAEAARLEVGPPRDLDTEADYRDLIQGLPPRGGEGFEL